MVLTYNMIINRLDELNARETQVRKFYKPLLERPNGKKPWPRRHRFADMLEPGDVVKTVTQSGDDLEDEVLDGHESPAHTSPAESPADPLSGSAARGAMPAPQGSAAADSARPHASGTASPGAPADRAPSGAAGSGAPGAALLAGTSSSRTNASTSPKHARTRTRTRTSAPPHRCLWSPGPLPSPVFRSAICDCLSLNVSISLGARL